MHISANSLDDLLRGVFTVIQKSNVRTTSSKGSAKERRAVSLTLKNPRARFSRTENRGVLFSGLGELLWYLSRRNDLEFIQYYISRYAESSDDKDTLRGAYGPRIFDFKGINQFENVRKILAEKKSDSRQAVIQVFSAEDIASQNKDVPCTCTLQFMKRSDRLHMITSMRSNDAYIGLPHDVFAFTMLQEIMARWIGCEIGEYHHFVGSLHLYDENLEGAKKYLSEGWQSAKGSMPPMPPGDPWPSIEWLLKAEDIIRHDALADIHEHEVEHYWRDLASLLRIKALLKKDITAVDIEMSRMTSRVYDQFIQTKESQVIAKKKPDQPLLPGIDGDAL